MTLSKIFRFFAGLGLLAIAATAQAAPCLIFVHGKQTDTSTYTS